MGSPYPDSVHRPLLGWVGGWVEHDNLFPARRGPGSSWSGVGGGS